MTIEAIGWRSVILRVLALLIAAVSLAGVLALFQHREARPRAIVLALVLCAVTFSFALRTLSLITAATRVSSSDVGALPTLVDALYYCQILLTPLAILACVATAYHLNNCGAAVASSRTIARLGSLALIIWLTGIVLMLTPNDADADTLLLLLVIALVINTIPALVLNGALFWVLHRARYVAASLPQSRLTKR